MKKQLFSAAIILLLIINFSYSYNPEQQKILLNKEIPGAWDKWRKQNPNIKIDLSGANINAVIFTGDFSFGNFRKSKISKATFFNADFIHTDLSYCEMKNLDVVTPYTSNRASFVCRNSSFFRAKIMDSEFTFAEFFKVNFNEVEFFNVNFQTCIIKNTSFLKSKIINLNISCQNLNLLNFSYSNMNKSIIVTIIPHVDKMYNIKFEFAKVNQSVIAGDMFNVSFYKSDLTNSSFYYFKLPDGSTLTNVNFTNANLTNVNFHKSKFNNVIFKNADMTGAKLERKWYSYVKKQGVRNFDKIQWM